MEAKTELTQYEFIHKDRLMNLDRAKEILLTNGHKITDERRLNNNTGVQLRTEDGAIVNIFDKGTYNIQGKNADKITTLFESIVGSATHTQVRANKNVFVVYGHDPNARTQLEAMLRRWGLEPLILDQLPSEGQTLIEKLEHYTDSVNFAVVLATPDDEGFRAGRVDEKAFRARQNVVLELGMLLSLLGRSRVAILIKEQDKMERPSDIQGLIYIPFKDNLEKEAGVILAKEMCSQGFDIKVSKL